LNGLLCGLEGGFQELPRILTGISLLEYGATCYQDLSASTHNVRYRALMHPAVYFNAKLQPARLSDFREQLDFLQGRMNKGLAAESRVHTHDKNMMN